MITPSIASSNTQHHVYDISQSVGMWDHSSECATIAAIHRLDDHVQNDVVGIITNVIDHFSVGFNSVEVNFMVEWLVWVTSDSGIQAHFDLGDFVDAHLNCRDQIL